MPLTLTLAAALGLANLCAPNSDPGTILSIAYAESGLRPHATNKNRDLSVDYGLMQINDSNFRWLGLTAKTALDPCRSMAAAERVLIANYHPSAQTPQAQQKALLKAIAAYNCPRCGDNKPYVQSVQAAAQKIIPQLHIVGAKSEPIPVMGDPPKPAPIPPARPSCAPSWDLWALASCSNRQKSSNRRSRLKHETHTKHQVHHRSHHRKPRS